MTTLDEKARWRSLRREAALRHHPDLGGDPEEFIRVMRAFSREPGRSGQDAAPNSVRITTAPDITSSTRSRVRHQLRSTGRRVALRVRTRIPRSFPGSRRYGHL